MRIIHVDALRQAVCRLYRQACCHLGGDVAALLQSAYHAEQSPLGREVLSQILENARIASEHELPICQDTGAAVVFLTIGQDVHLTGGDAMRAVDQGIAQAVEQGGLRASIVADPINRTNTGDNTPAIVHIEITPGEGLEIEVAPKGFGSENMSKLWMLPPSAGAQGVEDAIVETVRLAGGNPCPPVIVGVGIGGSAEGAMLLAKRSLLRTAGELSQDDTLAGIERRSLARINALGIGPMGLGGHTTALSVHCQSMPTHIAALPVGVNIQCHCARHARLAL